MGPPVGWDDAKEAPVHIIVQKHHLAGVLEDLVGRSNAWHARRLALEQRVGLDLAVVQIFDFGQELRFVLRKISCCGRVGCRSSITAAPASAGRWVVTTAWRSGGRRRWTTEHANGTVRQCLRPYEADTTAVVPCSIQVRPAIRQMRRRLRRC